MPATTALRASAPLATAPKTAAAARKPLSWKEFQSRYLRREDGYKYEWVDGHVVKSIRTMDKTQLFILRNLVNHFYRLLSTRRATGHLLSEPDLFFDGQHRRPDIAWLTDQQIDRLAVPECLEVPAFIIEVVSTNDQINLVEQKMDNYRDAGVAVVWQIFPRYKKVHVYSGRRLGQMVVCEGDAPCSAAPALPDFEMPASEIFRLG